MKEIIIFGKKYKIFLKASEDYFVEVKGNKIFISAPEDALKSILKEYLSTLLRDKLYEIYREMCSGREVEIVGDLEFRIVDKIDHSELRVAKFQENVILVKLSAISLPISALKYIVAHEIAHIIVKKHTEKFWDIVRKIYPKFYIGRRVLMRYKEILQGFLEWLDSSDN